MSENNSEKAASPRPLTRAELDGYRQEFDRLAAQFDDHAATLLRSPDNPLVIPDQRFAMSRAGRALKRILYHGAIPAPHQLPPWLSWRTKGCKRPMFSGLLGRSIDHRGTPSRTVRHFVSVITASPQVFDKTTARKPDEHACVAFTRRHIWAEAVSDWLGQRCTPRLSVVVPPIVALIDASEGRGGEVRQPIVHDWMKDGTQQRLLFLDLARDSAAACRYLSAELARQAGTPPPYTHVEQAPRPSRAARDAATDMLTRIFSGFLPADLMGPMLDYLAAKGVVIQSGASLEIAGKPGLLTSYPPDAQRALHAAILDHAGTSACPKILQMVIPTIAVGGSGSVSQGAGSSSRPRTPDVRPHDAHDVERLKWDRNKHVESLAGFGQGAAERVIDEIIARRSRRLGATSIPGEAQAPEASEVRGVAPKAVPATQQATAAEKRPVPVDRAKARGELLIGWKGILSHAGIPNERKGQLQLKRLNEKRGGPIVYVGTRPKVYSGVLMEWLNSLGTQADQDPVSTTDAERELNHPAEMRDLGFQTKERPNNPGSLARKSGYEQS